VLAHQRQGRWWSWPPLSIVFGWEQDVEAYAAAGRKVEVPRLGCPGCGRLSLFRHEDHLDAFQGAGLDVEHEPEGLMGRGLFLGTRRG
jgi:hypothetical protein